MVMPEMGFDELPMMPTMRLATVTKKKPKTTMSSDSRSELGELPGEDGQHGDQHDQDHRRRPGRPAAAGRARCGPATRSPPRAQVADRVAEAGDDGRQGLEQGHHPGAGHSPGADVLDVGGVDLRRPPSWWRSSRRSCPGRAGPRCAAPRARTARSAGSAPARTAPRRRTSRRDPRADDVADAQVLGGRLAAQRGVGIGRLAGPIAASGSFFHRPSMSIRAW